MPITEILEKLRKEQKTRKPSCTPCNIAIYDATTRFNGVRSPPPLGGGLP